MPKIVIAPTRPPAGRSETAIIIYLNDTMITQIILHVNVSLWQSFGIK